MSSSSSSSSEDEASARFASVAVSSDAVLATQKAIAAQGQQRLQGTSTVQRSLDPQQPTSDGGGSLPSGTTPSDPSPLPQELGIIEKRISDALDKRIEKVLNDNWSEPLPRRCKGSPPSLFHEEVIHETEQAKTISLGPGLRLFKRAASGRPVIVVLSKEDAPILYEGGKGEPMSLVMERIARMRFKREAQLAAETAHHLACMAQGKDMDQDGFSHSLHVEEEDRSDLHGHQHMGGSLSDQVALRQTALSAMDCDITQLAKEVTRAAATLQAWAEAEPGSSRLAKKMRKALKCLSIDGADLIRAASQGLDPGREGWATGIGLRLSRDKDAGPGSPGLKKAGQGAGPADGRRAEGSPSTEAPGLKQEGASADSNTLTGSEQRGETVQPAQTQQEGTTKKVKSRKAQRAAKALKKAQSRHEGVVIEGKKVWVPHNERMAHLLGTG